MSSCQRSDPHSRLIADQRSLMAPLEQKEQEPPSSLCGLLEEEERPVNEDLISSRPSHISQTHHAD